MANIFWTKRVIVNRARALESTRGLLHRLKISWTSFHKRVKIWPEFSPTLHKFSVLHASLLGVALSKRNPTKLCQREEVNGADASRIRWRCIVNVNETIEIRSLVFRGPKTIIKLQWHRVGRPSVAIHRQLLHFLVFFLVPYTYDTIQYNKAIIVRSKVTCSQLSLPHITKDFLTR